MARPSSPRLQPTQWAEAFAPGSIGNVGPGLDVLGLAVAGPGDTVRAERTDEEALIVADPGHPSLPTDPAHHASALAADAVRRLAGVPRTGAVLHITKGLPLAGGQGGSAASAAAGAGAMNALLGGPLNPEHLILAALEAETIVAGRHADNLAPAILGGLVLIRSLSPPDLVQLPVPPGLHVVLVHPHMQFRTADGRAALPRDVPRALALHQAAQVGAIVAAAFTGDLGLLGRAIDDRLAEPARAPLLPGFTEAKRAALEAGALGCSISGSGPTVFAFASDTVTAERAATAMRAAYAAAGLESDARVCLPDHHGLRVRTA
jgi:homoserine kinase